MFASRFNRSVDEAEEIKAEETENHEEIPAAMAAAADFDPEAQGPAPAAPPPPPEIPDFVPAGDGKVVEIHVIGKGTIEDHTGKLSAMFGSQPTNQFHMASVHQSVFHFNVNRRSAALAKETLEKQGYAVEFP